MRLRTSGLALLAALLTACAGDKPAEGPVAPAGAPDMHNSQNSLDWSGSYEGIVACTDCAGIQTRLTLSQDGSYELVRRQLVRGAAPATVTGQFTWQADGNTIALDAAGGAQGFAVGEGRVIALNSDGSRPDGAGAALTRLPTPQPGARTGLVQVLEDHRWTLTAATDAGNQRIDALFPSTARGFAFTFAESRVAVDGGCNGLRGGFEVRADGLLSIGRMAATMMACEPPLMAADKALADLLAAPLELVLAQGPEPTLAMLAESGAVLLLAGQLTPEARYGPATTLFLEIGPQRLPCDNSPAGDGLCLQVREIAFDAQGLRVGTPGEFQPFSGSIEGFSHTAGTRNVLRIKRFQPGGQADLASAVLVLDLMVESATVDQ
jgi:heat shock protein HslJ